MLQPDGAGYQDLCIFFPGIRPTQTLQIGCDRDMKPRELAAVPMKDDS